MDYLTAHDVLEIHSIVIDETGGSHGVRDRDLLASAIGQPQQSFAGAELYKTVFEKAAAYARSIIQNHPFIDGNKRTAMTVADVFLTMNGYKIMVPKGGIESFAYYIIEQKPEISEIAAWLAKNSKPAARE